MKLKLKFKEVKLDHIELKFKEVKRAKIKLYFEEIQWRMRMVAASQIFTGAILYYYKSTVLFLIIYPVVTLEKSPVKYFFIYTGVTEPHSVFLDVGLFIIAQFTAIFFMLHFFIFIKPALNQNEYKNLVLFMKIVILLWVVSLVTVNSFISGTWLSFLNSYSSNRTICSMHFETKLVEYLNFYISSYLENFLYYQITGFLVFLLNLPRSTAEVLFKYRRLSYLCFVIVGAISCPDVLSQLNLVVSLIVIYELGLAVKLFALRVGQVIKTSKKHNKYIEFLLFLSALFRLTAKVLYKYRKLSYPCFVIIGAISCPDVLSQLNLAVSLIVMYELGLAIKLFVLRVRQIIKTRKKSNNKY